MTEGVVFMQVTDFRAWTRVIFVRTPIPRCAPTPRFARRPTCARAAPASDHRPRPGAGRLGDARL